MQLPEIICVVVVSTLILFNTIGVYILQRQKYWNQIWEGLGSPGVKNVKELKALSRERGRAKS